MQAQFNSLSNLHAALHGREINGWKVFNSTPVIHPQVSAGIGDDRGSRETYRLLRDQKTTVLTSRDLLDAARAFVTTMQQYWSERTMSRRPGSAQRPFRHRGQEDLVYRPRDLESCPVCNGCTRSQSPAVLDLAHTLYDVTIDVSDLVGSADDAHAQRKLCRECLAHSHRKHRLTGRETALVERNLEVRATTLGRLLETLMVPKGIVA